MSYGMAWCGDFRLGDAADHEKIEKKALSFKYRRSVKVTRKSVVLSEMLAKRLV